MKEWEKNLGKHPSQKHNWISHTHTHTHIVKFMAVIKSGLILIASFCCSQLLSRDPSLFERFVCFPRHRLAPTPVIALVAADVILRRHNCQLPGYNNPPRGTITIAWASKKQRTNLFVRERTVWISWKQDTCKESSEMAPEATSYSYSVKVLRYARIFYSLMFDEDR